MFVLAGVEMASIFVPLVAMGAALSLRDASGAGRSRFVQVTVLVGCWLAMLRPWQRPELLLYLIYPICGVCFVATMLEGREAPEVAGDSAGEP